MYGTLGAGVFPKILFSILAILGTLLTINSIVKERKAKSSSEQKPGEAPQSHDLLKNLSGYSYVFVGFLSVLGYMLLMKYIGYTYSTLIFMPALMWILGPKNRRAMWITASVTLGVTFSIYLLFQKVFNIFLPEGELF